MSINQGTVAGQFIHYLDEKSKIEKTAFNHALELAGRLEKLKSKGLFKDVEVSPYLNEILRLGKVGKVSLAQ